jgi:hypothetical protein
MQHRTASILFALVLIGLSTPAWATCPTAREDIPLNPLVWKTTRQLDGFIWSADGAQILGIETLYEEKKYWNPWYVTTQKRNFCHQLYWTTLDGATRQDIGSPNELAVVEAFAFARAGYVVIEKHSESSPWIFERVGLDGQHTPLASIDGSCDWARAIPSPDGAFIAFVHTRLTHCGSTTLNDSTTTVSFFDANGAPTGGSGSVTLAGYALSTWTPDGRLVVTDRATASSVAVDGAVTPTTVPRCTDPSTTSSKVDAQGRMLEIGSGKPAVVANAPDRAFGCQ